MNIVYAMMKYVHYDPNGLIDHRDQPVFPVHKSKQKQFLNRKSHPLNYLEEKIFLRRKKGIDFVFKPVSKKCNARCSFSVGGCSI
jgi:hypothetical protein